jgi:hypothetical protein
MRDLSLLKNKLTELGQQKRNPAPKHPIRFAPFQKDDCKKSGAKFTMDDGWFFESFIPDDHPLAKYRKGDGRWIEVLNIPFELRTELKDSGVISEKGGDGKWRNYVHVEDGELIEALGADDALNIGFAIEE